MRPQTLVTVVLVLAVGACGGGSPVPLPFGPDAGALTAMSCTGGVCSCSSAHCAKTCTSAPSNADCSGGYCDNACAPTRDCQLRCSGGFCRATCGAGACDVNCSGGNCNMACPNGATCDVMCSRGAGPRRA